MRRKWALVLCAALTAMSLAGCGGKTGETNAPSAESSAGKTESTPEGTQEAQAPSGDVMTIEFFQQKGEEGPQKGYQAIIDKFNAANPDIRIEMNTVPDAGTVLTSRISSGDIPVIFSDYPTQQQFRQKVANGYVQDLSGQDFLKNVNESSLEMTKQEDGGYYALPYSRNYMGVFYNMDIFEEQNLDIPETWDEFMELCGKLKDAGIQPLEESYKDTGMAGHYRGGAMAALFPDGALWLAECAQDPEKKPSDNPDYRTFAEKAIQIMDYCNEDVFGIPQTQAMENFANGKAAMMIYGSYGRGTFLVANPDLNLGVFPIPGLTKDSGLVYAGVDACFCVSGKATPEEQDAGLKWIEFLSRPENAQKWSDTEGAPSAIDGVQYGSEGSLPMLNRIKEGKVREWKAYYDSRFSDTEAFQGLLMDRDVDKFLKNADEVWANAHVSG